MYASRQLVAAAAAAAAVAAAAAAADCAAADCADCALQVINDVICVRWVYLYIFDFILADPAVKFLWPSHPLHKQFSSTLLF